MDLIEFADFAKIKLCLATIIDAQDFARAKKPAYKITLDCGIFGVKQSSAQITQYSKAELLGKQVIACVNLKPRNIAGFISECLITGFYQNDGSVILATVDSKGTIPNGSILG